MPHYPSKGKVSIPPVEMKTTGLAQSTDISKKLHGKLNLAVQLRCTALICEEQLSHHAHQHGELQGGFDGIWGRFE